MLLFVLSDDYKKKLDPYLSVHLLSNQHTALNQVFVLHIMYLNNGLVSTEKNNNNHLLELNIYNN